MLQTKKKVSPDGRLKTLLDNNVKLGHRSILVLLGENARDQVMIIHHLLSKTSDERPSVLWCHGKNSDIPSQTRKHIKKLEKRLKSGKCDISQENAFDIFLLSTSIKYCSFRDTQKVLGNTYGMCVIQDFEGLTPNTLCRVIETVGGGGTIVFLMSKMGSLRQLFSLKMDVHQKLKTHSHPNINPIFNERFVLSLGWCKSCLVLNDQLQLITELPSLTSPVSEVGTSKLAETEASQSGLHDLLQSLEDGEKPLPQLAKCCKTLDQAKALLKMIDAITEKGGRRTVSVTASRGRGKSAALGLAVAAAVHFGLNNMFVTSPSPENLNTFFEFVFKGFDALEYKEQVDYEIIQSTNVEYNNAIIRVNIFQEYRQTIQYVDPSDSDKLSQAELVVIDEAAAIPLPHVKAFIGPYNVLMASTINGYEGTGRSLSLKLLQQLRQQSGSAGATAVTAAADNTALSGRSLDEVSMEESVRYASGDPVEKWLHQLLCLDATSILPHTSTCPPPQHCQLYYVNRDVLFSGHRESDEFLQQVMSLLVASHYRNSPDDLQVLSDAPAHHLFVLLPPIAPGKTSIPTILTVIQMCLEGGIPSSVATACKSRGERPSGDLIPWTLASQFLDPALTQLQGARIVRVAAHPDYQSMGYGSQALSLLRDYFKGKHITLDDDDLQPSNKSSEETIENGDAIVPRKRDQPLLSKLSERMPESLDYLGVSYGLTFQLHKFWRRAGYIPLYISQVANKVTGEHSCVMVQPIEEPPAGETTGDSSPFVEWIKKPSREFLRRFMSLLSGPFSDLPPLLALNVVLDHAPSCTQKEIEWHDLKAFISGHDIQRLQKYSQNLADRHLISDLLPAIANLFFTKRFPSVHLSSLQSSLLVGLGLQMKHIDKVISLIDLPIESALGQFNRAIRRLLKAIVNIQETALARHLPAATTAVADFTPVDISLDQDLSAAAKDYEEEAEKTKGQQITSSGLLGNVKKYAIQGDDKAWETALQTGQGSLISVKSSKRPVKMTEAELERELEGPTKKKKKKKGKSSSKD